MSGDRLAQIEAGFEGAQFGYTLGTGKLFADFAGFQEWAEALLDRPILTHEFADEQTWLRLRGAFEERVLARLDSGAAEENT